MSKWIDDEIKMRSYGVTESKIKEEKERRLNAYKANGISEDKINEIFDIKKPDQKTLENVFNNNLKDYKPEEADTFFDAIDAGWQLGSAPIIKKVLSGENALPNMVVPEHAPSYMKVAQGLATVAGDIPVMVAGYIGGKSVGAAIGAGLGSKVPAIGTTAGAVVGGELGAQFVSNALPEAIRTAAMEYYSRGEIKTSREFFDLASEVFIKSAKAGTVGVATYGVGKGVGRALSGKIGNSAMKASSLGAEIVTMTTLGKGLEGELPSLEDFTTSAAIIASIGTIASGFRYSANVTSKLQKIYAKTGMKPAEVVAEVENNPDLQSQFFTEGDSIPEFFNAPKETPLLPAKKDSGVATVDSKEMTTTGKDLVVQEPSAAQLYAKEFERGDVDSDIYGAMNRFKESVGPKKKTTADIDAEINKFLKDAPAKAYTMMVEKEYPVKMLMDILDKDMPMDDKNSYVLQRVYNGYQGKVMHFLNHGTLKADDLSTNGPSLKMVIDKAGKDTVGLSAYLTALRVYSLKKLRNIDQPMSVADAEVIIKDFDPKMREAAEMMYSRRRKVLEYGRDLGLYSEDFIKDLEKTNPFYIPLRKIMESETNGIGKSNLFKKIKSKTDAQLVDPIEASIMSEAAIIRLAEQNRFRTRVVEQLAEVGLATKKEDKSVDAKRLDQDYIDWKKTGEIEITRESDLSIFEDVSSQLKDNEIYRRVNGKVEIWELSKDAPPLLKESIESIGDNPISDHWSMKVFQAYTTVKKLGITLPLEFMLSNISKDYQGTMVKTIGGKENTWKEHVGEYYSAIMSLALKNDEQYRAFLKGGGGFSDWAGSGNWLAELDLANFEQPKYKDARQQVINGFSKAKEIYATMQFISENLSRFVEDKRVRDGETVGPKMWTGALAGKDIALDYQRRGMSTTLANYASMKAYLNIAIQGPDNTLRYLSDPKIPFSTKSLRIAQYVTIPAILSWLVMKDREEYKQAQTWEKAVYNFYPIDYWVEVKSTEDMLVYNSNTTTTIGRSLNRDEDGRKFINKGFVARIPKVEGFGTLFGTIPVMMLDRYYQDKPTEFEEFKQNFFNQVIGLAVPDALQTPFEQFSNKSFFTGNKIVPTYLEGASPYLQYKEYTSDTARAIGNLIGRTPIIGKLGPDNAKFSSPVIVDQYIRNTLGTSGQYVTQLLDTMIPKSAYARSKYEKEIEKGYTSLNDIPVIKRFVQRFPNASMASIEKFNNVYDEYRKFQIDESVEKKRQNFESAMDARLSRLQEVGEIGRAKLALSNLHGKIHKIMMAENLDESDKKRLIESAYFGMVDIANRGLDLHRQVVEKKQKLKEQGIEQ